MDSIHAGESSPAPPLRSRRRLSRTFSPGRWPEYGRLLKAALGAGYQIVTLEDFLDSAVGSGAPVFILRHDVDQCAKAALRMSDIEMGLGLRSTWYFRWRTAQAAVIEEVRRRGGEIGLHYETLSREALNTRREDELEPAVRLRAAREQLRDEIATFAALFGPIRSVAAHGDTRVPWVRNAELLRDEEWSEYGIDYDANDAMRRHQLAAWLTDRSSAEGGWSGEADPFSLIGSHATPILCLTHPNNWVSGPTLWWDRLFVRSFGRSSDVPPRPT